MREKVPPDVGMRCRMETISVVFSGRPEDSKPRLMIRSPVASIQLQLRRRCLIVSQYKVMKPKFKLTGRAPTMEPSLSSHEALGIPSGHAESDQLFRPASAVPSTIDQIMRLRKPIPERNTEPWSPTKAPPRVRRLQEPRGKRIRCVRSGTFTCGTSDSCTTSISAMKSFALSPGCRRAGDHHHRFKLPLCYWSSRDLTSGLIVLPHAEAPQIGILTASYAKNV